MTMTGPGSQNRIYLQAGGAGAAAAGGAEQKLAAKNAHTAL